jgi:hypothetical protein
MRKLESTIAEFVDALLQTIGEATIDELRELFAGRPESERLPEAAVEFSSAAPPGRPAPAPRAPRVEGREPRRAFTTFAASSGAAAPPGVAEITDPESLLSLGRPREASGSNGAAPAYSNGTPANGAEPSFTGSRRAPSRARAQALLEVREGATPADGQTRHVEAEGDSPASGVRPVGSGSTVKLSDNETLARVSNSGVIIRRKKRALA